MDEALSQLKIRAGIINQPSLACKQTAMARKVAIIGAGISGLLACKYLLSKGFSPTIFESKDDVGGVWTETLEITKLQTPKAAYQFSDFPWPSSVKEDFPSHDQVLSYIKSYADHFDLRKYIKFNTKVSGIKYEGPLEEEEIEAWDFWGGNGDPFGPRGKWKVTAKDTQSLLNETNGKKEQDYLVDFVILCVGRFSDVPNIPEFPPNRGPEELRGTVIHSMEYAAMDTETASKFVKGKQISIVGLQKSALDIAMECSNVNGIENPCTVIYKTEHWNLPNYLPWGVPLAFLYLNRFSELLIHKPGEGSLLRLLATILSPVRWAFAKFVESYIKSKLRLERYGMVPKHGFPYDLSSCMVSTVPEKFYDRVDEGSIILKKSQNFSFCENGILVGEEATQLQTDLVILATGFKGDKKLKDIFLSPKFQEYIQGPENSAIRLYRECIHPRIPQLAVIGYSESLSNLFTSEMRSRWVAELLGGTFRVPSIREMEKDMMKWDAYMKLSSGKNNGRSSIGAINIWYNDLLCKDMGWNHRRKKGYLAELFEPYGPSDYVSS